jgi:MFS family permease
MFVTAQGVGAVAGALLVPALAVRLGRRRLLLWGLVALPTAVVLYGLAPSPPFAVAALALVGATYICVFSGLGTVVQLRAPAEMRGRVVSVYFLALGTLYPVGSLIQGPIGDRIGLGQVTVAGAVALLVLLGVTQLVRPERYLALDDLDVYPAPA